jgi:predicted negative regulator of RcsB-dependent stress response
VDDYLSEKEQWEALKGWLRENGVWIFAGLIVGGLGLGGWRLYQARVDDVASQASGKYDLVIQAFDKGDRTQGMVYLGELERDYGASPYADQGKLAAARLYVDGGELDKAAKELEAVAQHSKDRDLALVARIRLARVQIAQQNPDGALATLNGIEPSAFGPRFHEVRGDAYYAKGDKANALKEYRMARASDMGGVTDTSLLNLKIADLIADSASAPATAKADAAPAATPAK